MKNIYYILSIITISLILACSNTTKNQETSVAVENNTLTEKETTEGWRLLFDGKTSDGWRGYKKETFPTDWNITDEGEIYMSASGRGEAGSANGGDIIYDQKFSNFHVKLEWKVSEGGNSGIFYLGQETPEFDYIWRTAPEMQILDNDRHPDAFLGRDGNRQAGALYDSFVNLTDELKKVGNQIGTVQNSYDKAMKKLTGKGNLVKRVEKLKQLGAKASKQIDPKLINQSINELDS